MKKWLDLDLSHKIESEYLRHLSIYLETRNEVYYTKHSNKALYCYNILEKKDIHKFKYIINTNAIQKTQDEILVFVALQSNIIQIICTENKEILKTISIKGTVYNNNLVISNCKNYILYWMNARILQVINLQKNLIITEKRPQRYARGNKIIGIKKNRTETVFSIFDKGLVAIFTLGPAIKNKIKFYFYKTENFIFSNLKVSDESHYCFIGVKNAGLEIFNVNTLKIVKRLFKGLNRSFYWIEKYRADLLVGSDTNFIEVFKGNFPFRRIKRYYLDSHRNKIFPGNQKIMIHGAKENGIFLYQFKEYSNEEK